MKKMTVDDITARLLLNQKLTVIEENSSKILCEKTTQREYENGAWRTCGKRAVYSMVAKEDVLYIYVEELWEDKI